MNTYDRITEMLIDMIIDFRLNEWLAPDQYKSRLQKNYRDARTMWRKNELSIDNQANRGKLNYDPYIAMNYGYMPREMGGARRKITPVSNPFDSKLAADNIEKLTSLRRQRANRVEAGKKPNFLQRLFRAPEPPTPKSVIMRRNQQLPSKEQKPTPRSISSGIRVGHLGGDMGVQKFRRRIELLRKLRGEK